MVRQNSWTINSSFRDGQFKILLGQYLGSPEAQHAPSRDKTANLSTATTLRQIWCPTRGWEWVILVGGHGNVPGICWKGLLEVKHWSKGNLENCVEVGACSILLYPRHPSHPPVILSVRIGVHGTLKRRSPQEIFGGFKLTPILTFGIRLDV